MSIARHASLVTALALVPASAQADEEAAPSDVRYQLEASVASDYVARATPQYAGHAPCSQNAAQIKVDHVGPGAVTLGMWTAVALSHYDAQPGTALEVDLTAGYAITRGALTISGGYAAYLFPSHAAGTPIDGAHEVFGQLSYETPYVVPTAAAWVEVAHQRGVYLTIGGSHDFHAGKWTVTPSVSVGGATYQRYLGADVAAAPHLNDLTAGLAARLELPDGLYAAVRGSYAYRGTPDELMPADGGMAFADRSTLVGLVALGVAR